MMKEEVTKRLLVKKVTEVKTNYRCSVIATLRLFSTKWKPCIICYLAKKQMRYNDLYRVIPNISRKMLSEHLKELEGDQLIVRIQFDYKLQRVEYCLSDRGRSLLFILHQLQDWGMNNIKHVLSIEEMLDISMG